MTTATTRPAIDTTSPLADEVQALAEIMEARYRTFIENNYKGIASSDWYPTSPDYRASVKARKAFWAVDLGSSGRYLVDAAGDVWSIKAYGVPNRRIGHISEVTNSIRQMDEYR